MIPNFTVNVGLCFPRALKEAFSFSSMLTIVGAFQWSWSDRIDPICVDSADNYLSYVVAESGLPTLVSKAID